MSISYDRLGILIQFGLNQAKYCWQISGRNKIFLTKQLNSDLEIRTPKTNVLVFLSPAVTIGETAEPLWKIWFLWKLDRDQTK